MPRTLALGSCMLLTGLLALSACSDATGPDGGIAYVQVTITDAPADYYETAEVWISRVYLAESEEGDGGGQVDLFNDPTAPKHYDLLTLRDGITADLTDVVEVEAGQYGQLRLVVDRAAITLKEPYTFSDGSQSRTLAVPSGHETGIKVLLKEEFDAGDGTLTDLLVDFDVNRNFVIQGSPGTPAGIQDILFTPTLTEMHRTVEPTPEE